MAGSMDTRGLTGRRVLVVEDEYFIGDDMAQALQHLGAEVVGPLPTLPRVLAFLASGERIDAAVLDINLRGEAVYPVADALTERGVPYVFATGYDKSAIPPAYQGVPHWGKPFDPEDLAKALPQVMVVGAANP